MYEGEDIKHGMLECQWEHSNFRKLRTVLNDALLLLVTPVAPPKVLITTVTTLLSVRSDAATHVDLGYETDVKTQSKHVGQMNLRPGMSLLRISEGLIVADCRQQTSK